MVLAAALLGAPGCKASEQADGGEQADPAPAPAPAPVSEPVAEPSNTTINQFYGRGTPTFVIGTSGDDVSDRAIAVQVELVRSLFFPTATIVTDTSIDVAAGPSAWPSNAVVYGGPQVNSLIAALELPFELGPGRLRIGDRTFEGDGYQFVAVVPAGPRNPEFLFYAGTGTPGIAEINGVTHGPEPLLVIDAFGRLATGSWARNDRLAAVLDQPARRIEWRTHERQVGSVKVRVAFPEQIPADEEEPRIVDAATRGLTTAVDRMMFSEPATIDLYVYPDRRSKESLTGNGGDGNAVVMADALHMLRFDAAPGGAFERVVVHEATHVLSHQSWGPAGTPLLGEGLAVYISGEYGGVELGEWAERIDEAPPITELLGPAFRQRPEAEMYPIAGLLVGAAVERVGLAEVREHLYAATAQSWADACERAGISAEVIADGLATAIAR